LGKSTLINTLFNTTLYPPKVPLPPAAERPKTVAIESIGAGMSFLSPFDSIFLTCVALDIEENGVRLHLTVVDTPGFGDFVNNDDRSVVTKIGNLYMHSYEFLTQLEAYCGKHRNAV
jgi:septin 7